MKRLFTLFAIVAPLLTLSQAVLPTAWNFSTPGIETPPTGWSYDLGTTGNKTYTGNGYFVAGDGVGLRLDFTGEYLQIQFGEKPGPLSYYIRGTGTSSPYFSGTFTVQESVDGNSWTAVHAFTSMTNQMTRYQHNLTATSRYVRFFYTEKQSGTNVAMDSVMIQLPPPPAQGIMVKQNNDVLLNGGQFVFGNATTKRFLIQNIGVSEDLKIDSITIKGTHASDFSIGAFDSTVTFNNGLDSFDVNFTAGANGSRFATLKVYSTDTEKNPFTINLYAIGGTLATEPTSQISQLNISNVRAHTMNVSFPRAAGTEKYLLLRKTGTNLTETPVDGTTYKRGDYIGGAQVAYIGDDSTLLKPNYIIANTAYTFSVFPFNGTDGFENYKTDAFASSSTTTLANEIGNYYANVNPLSLSFVTDLKNRLKTPHDTIYYSYYIGTLINNYLARDTTGGKKVVNCVYTGAPYIYDEPFLWRTGTNSGTLTREHSFCQSWMASGSVPGFPDNVDGKELLEFNDLHHLFPAHHDNANGKRSNHPLGVVANPTYTAPTGVGKLGTDAGGKTVYEPRDEHKGDAARAILYMLVRYNGDRNLQWRLPVGQDLNVLLQWHQQDPPSALEIARNEYIASIQHNRNPFIDNPSWVDRIDFSNMTYIPDPNASYITVTAPATNATIIAGTTSTISWTSTNVDSVLVELQDASGSFKTIGKYAASQGSVSYQFNEAATNNAFVRVSKVSGASVFATSGTFKIVQSVIEITKPIYDEMFQDNRYNIVVKWNKLFVDSADIILYSGDIPTQMDSLTIIGSTTADSVVISGLPTHNVQTFYAVYVTEKATDKSIEFLARDTVTFKLLLSDGIAENNTLNNYVSVYPIPSKGMVNVSVAGNLQIEKIKVYDVAGRLLQTTKDTKLYLSNAGLYFLHVETDKGKIIKKVIIE